MMTEGPIDHTVEALRSGDRDAAPSRPLKPFGGKALMRPLSALDRRGLHSLADADITRLLPGEAHEGVAEARASYSAAPLALMNGQAGQALMLRAPERREGGGDDVPS